MLCRHGRKVSTAFDLRQDVLCLSQGSCLCFRRIVFWFDQDVACSCCVDAAVLDVHYFMKGVRLSIYIRTVYLALFQGQAAAQLLRQLAGMQVSSIVRHIRVRVHESRVVGSRSKLLCDRLDLFLKIVSVFCRGCHRDGYKLHRTAVFYLVQLLVTLIVVFQLGVRYLHRRVGDGEIRHVQYFQISSRVLRRKMVFSLSCCYVYRLAQQVAILRLDTVRQDPLLKVHPHRTRLRAHLVQVLQVLQHLVTVKLASLRVSEGLFHGRVNVVTLYHVSQFLVRYLDTQAVVFFL